MHSSLYLLKVNEQEFVRAFKEHGISGRDVLFQGYWLVFHANGIWARVYAPELSGDTAIITAYRFPPGSDGLIEAVKTMEYDRADALNKKLKDCECLAPTRITALSIRALVDHIISELETL